MSLAAFDDVTAVASRRQKLKIRTMCPHCRKVVTGKAHVRECAKLAAKSEDEGCIDCGDPVKGRRWRCEPCRKEARKDTAFKTRNRPGQKAIAKKIHDVWRVTERGKQAVWEGRTRWNEKNRAKLRAWSNAWKAKNRDYERARLKAYYEANKERISAAAKEKRRQARLGRAANSPALADQ